ETWVQRTGTRLRALAEYLRDHGRTAKWQEIVEGIAQVLEPNEYEATVRSNGYPVWLSDLLWQTTNMVKAGWLTKDGSGMWTLTDAGVAALDDHVDPADFL